MAGGVGKFQDVALSFVRNIGGEGKKKKKKRERYENYEDCELRTRERDEFEVSYCTWTVCNYQSFCGVVLEFFWWRNDLIRGILLTDNEFLKNRKNYCCRESERVQEKLRKKQSATGRKFWLVTTWGTMRIWKKKCERFFYGKIKDFYKNAIYKLLKLLGENYEIRRFIFWWMNSPGNKNFFNFSHEKPAETFRDTRGNICERKFEWKCSFSTDDTDIYF